jgi:uncharacterized protein (DUF983 family)
MEDNQERKPRLAFEMQPLPEIEYPLKVGSLCPQCGQERLDYNGMLNLACARCGYELAGCFT